MASYTIELGTVCRLLHAGPSDNWAAAWDTIGLSGYPIYDETHRGELNGRIIRHYYLREIGVETVEMFGYYVDEAMRLIMPAYNKMYQSALLDVSHLLGVSVDALTRDLTTRTLSVKDSGTGTMTGHTSTTTSESGTSTEDTLDRNLDTPQSQVTLLDDGYLTDASKGHSEATSTREGETGGETSQSTESASTRDEGETTNYEHERTEQRTDPRYFNQLVDLGRQILDIDRMVIEDNELRQCFMTIF